MQYSPDPRDAIAYIQTLFVQKSPPQTLLILAHPQELIDLGLKPDQYQIMDQAGAYQLIRVHKT